jgi:hypothetical protein
LEVIMPRKKSSLLNDLSTADLKQLLAARERIDVLEVEQSRLMKALAKVEKELGKLMSGTAKAGAGSGKKVRRKTVRKKAVAKKAGRKKVVRKKVVRKKTVKKKAPQTRKAAGSGKMKLEDVIVSVIRKNRKPMAFQDLKARIVKGKLFKSKSGNFDNVLRRTLSTSKAVKRVARGVYGIA